MAKREWRLSVGIDTVLEKDSLQRTEKKIEELKEPIKIKVDLKDAEQKLDRLGNQITDLKQEETRLAKELSKAMASGDAKEVQNIVVAQQKVEGQLKRTTQEQQDLNASLRTYKKEMKAARGASKQLTDEERKVNDLIEKSKTSRGPYKKKVKDSASDAGNIETVKKETKANEDLAKSVEDVDKAKRKTRAKKPKTSDTDATKEEAKVNQQLANSVDEVIQTKRKSKSVKPKINEADAAKQQAKANEALAKSYEKVGEAAKAAGEKEQKRTKPLNMKNVIKRYNSVARDIGIEHFEINDDNDNTHWTLRDMISQMKAELDSRYSDLDISDIGDADERKMYKNERKRIENFIKAYEPYIDGINTVINHGSQYDNTIKQVSVNIEKQTDVLKENTKAAKENVKAHKSIDKLNFNKPELLQHIDVLENKDSMYDAKTVAQKRKAAEQMLKEQWRLYQEMKKEYDDPENATHLYGTDYDGLLGQQKRLEAHIALYEKYGGSVEKVGKKLKEFSDNVGYTGNYKYEADEYALRTKEVQDELLLIDKEAYSTDNTVELSKMLDTRKQIVGMAKDAGMFNDEELQAQRAINAELQKRINLQRISTNVVYHAGDLSNPDKTLKSFRLGNVSPAERTRGFNGFTGLYTTEDVDGFWANEWDGAPISTIDLSHYKMFDAKSDELATKARTFFDNLNATIYGYLEYFDYDSGEVKKNLNVKNVEDLYAEFKEVFNGIELDFETFTAFIKNSKAAIAGNQGFIDLDLPAIDKDIAKSAQDFELQGVSKDVFNSDSFQTQLLKMLGFEGIDLRGTKFNGTYTGGTVVFDVKPESIKTTNEKWSDVMARNGYNITEEHLKREEKRRQLAFETAKAYSKQNDAQKEYYEMSHKEATDYIFAHYDKTLWDKWFLSQADDNARVEIAKKLESDFELRNASLNQMWHRYKDQAGSDMPFDDFLNAKIPVYRGEQSVDMFGKLQKFAEREFASFSLNKAVAQDFSGGLFAKNGAVIELVISPKDTLGMPRPKYENEGNGEQEIFIPMGDLSSSHEYLDFKNKLKDKQDKFVSGEEQKSVDVLITSYEDLCKVVTRYNELQNKDIHRTADEDIEFESLFNGIGNATSSIPLLKLRETLDYHGGYDVDKLAKLIDFDAIQKQLKISDIAKQVQEFIKMSQGLMPEGGFAEGSKEMQVYIGLMDQLSKGFVTADDAMVQLKQSLSVDNENKSIGQLVLELEKVSGKSLVGILNDYDNLDDGIKEKINSILKLMGLMNDQMEFTFSRSQGGNAKAVLGQDFVILQKSLESNEDYASNLINKLQEAQNLGINIAPIMERVFSGMATESNGFRGGYEIQQRAIGSNVHETQKELITLNNALQENQVVLSASDEALQKFISDYIKLDEVGLKVDPSKASNFLYDAEKGFSFIDLGLKNANDQAKDLKTIFKEITVILANTSAFNKLKQDESLGFSSGQIIAKIADSFEMAGLATREEIDSWAKEFYDGFGNIFDGYSGKNSNVSNWIDDIRVSADALGEEFKNSQQYKDFFAAIESGSINAENAVQELDSAFTNFSKHTLNYELPKLSDEEIASAFKSIDLDSFLKSFNITNKDDVATIKQLYIELLQVSKALANGDDVADKYNESFMSIIDTLVRFGSQTQNVSDEYKQFYEYMQNKKITFNEGQMAEFGDSWGRTRQRWSKKLVPYGSGKGIGVDQIWDELITNFPSLFTNPDSINEADQLVQLIAALDKTSQYRKNKWKESYAIQGDDLAKDVALHMNAMYNSIQSTVPSLNDESKAFENLEQKADAAADAKDRFSAANMRADKSAQTSLEGFGKESDELDEVEQEANAAADALDRVIKAQKNANGSAVLKGTTLEDFENYASQIAADQGMTLGQVHVLAGDSNNVVTASVQLLNRELAQSMTYTYEIKENAEEMAEAFLVSTRYSGNIDKAIRQAADAQKKADRERLQNQTWLIQQNKKLDTQTRSYKHSKKTIDGSLELMSVDSSLPDGVDKTIDNLAQHIRTRLQNAVATGNVTDSLRTSILNDLRILEDEIKVRQNEKYASTNMKASDITSAKESYQHYLDAMVSRSKKANVFGSMEQDIANLRKELDGLTDSNGLDKFIDNLRVVRNKLQAATSEQSLHAAEVKENEQAYNKLTAMQTKLYNAKRQLEKVDASSSKGIAAQRTIDEYQETYDYYMKLAESTDYYILLKRRELALEQELAAVRKEAGIKADGQYGVKMGAMDADVSSPDKLKMSMLELAHAVTQGNFELKGFNSTGTEMYGVMKTGANAIDEVTVALKSGSNELVAYRGASKDVSNEWNNLKSSIGGGIARIVGMYVGFQDIVRYVSQGISAVRELDAAMTELKKVTDETDQTYAAFLNTASHISKSIGSTLQDFTTVTSDFARLGYSIEQSTNLAKTALVYENVGDGFSNVSEASESIISTMKAFGIEANDTMGIVDRFNEVGNNFAITSKGIGDALQRSASALVEGGNTIDESIALVTAANSVIQNPEQVGTALKTLSLRLRGTKVELEEAGLDTDNMANSVSTLREKLLALTHGKVDIMFDENNFKNTTEILREMSQVWDELSDVDRASALELMGGKRQANILSSIISNFEVVEDVIKTSANSAGSAAVENRKHMESLQGRIDIFNNSLQTLYNNTLKSDWLKWFVDRGTDIIQILDTAHGKILAVVAAIKLIAKFNKTSILGIAQGALSNIGNLKSAKSTLNAFGAINLLGSQDQTAALQQYAAAVANLTAKQQANYLASAGLSKQQIQMAMQYNGLESAVINEATAHVFAKNAKDQEAISDANLLQQKTQLLTASYQNQAAKMREVAATQTGTAATMSEIAADEALAAANFLEANSSTGVTLAKVQEAIRTNEITAATGAEIIAKLGLAKANQTLLGTIVALFKSNPIGWIMTAVGLLVTIVPLIKSIIPTTEDLIKEWDTAKQKVEDINDELESTQNRINELNDQGVLSIADKKELELLKQQNDELERRLRIAQKAEDSTAEDTRKALREDYKKEFESNKYKSSPSEAEFNKYDVANSAMNAIESIMNSPDANIFDTLSKAQQDAIKQSNETVYNLLKDNSWAKLTKEETQEVISVYNQFAQDVQNLDYINNPTEMITGSERIDQLVQQLQEYKNQYNDIINDDSLSKEAKDEKAIEIATNIDDVETELANFGVSLGEYLDNYGDVAASDKVGKEFVGAIKTQLEKIDMAINPVQFYEDKFNEILGKYSDEKQKLYELAQQGKLTADILNDTTYAPLIGQLSQLGITAQDVADHINSLSASQLNKVVDPSFNIGDYIESINSVNEEISTLQSMLDSLESGSFTHGDFIELIKKFPDLAKGVDVTSDSFDGLADNLLKAIDAAPDSLVKELKNLRKELVETGKDTTHIDNLIYSLEQLPSDAVSELSGEFGTLADKMNAANIAQGKLTKAMNEDPNANYKNTSEAMKEMKELIDAGMVGSGSKIWDMYEALTGKTYDYTKSLQENVDALKLWFKAKSSWYNIGDEDEYSHKGLEYFLNDVEAVIAKNDELKAKVKWTYKNGVLNLDFDKASWKDIAGALDITEEQFADLMVQVSQFFEINWDSADGLLNYLISLKDEGKTLKEQFDTITPSLQAFLSKYNLSSEDIAGLLEGKFDISDYPEDLQKLLNAYYDLQDKIKADPLEIVWTLNKIELTTEQQEIANEMKSKFSDTPVDLTMRPRVDWKEMHKAGWFTDEGYSTVDTSTIYASEVGLADSEENDYFLNVTPILPDGTVIKGGEEGLLSWIRSELHSGKKIEELDVYLGSYKTIEEASEAAQLLHEMHQEFYDAMVEGGLPEDSIAALSQLVDVIHDADTNVSFIDFEQLKASAAEAGYTQEAIDSLITSIQRYGTSVIDLKISEKDPFGLGGIQGAIESAENYLDVLNATSDYLNALSIKASVVEDSIQIDLPSFVSVMQASGWTVEKVQEYVNSLVSQGYTFAENGIAVDIATNADEVNTKVSDLYTTAENAPDEEIKIDLTGNAESCLKSITDYLANIKDKEIDITVNRKTNYSSGFGFFANGTAHANGNWGAPRTETALVGELGPEMVVRGNRWFTVGDNGAEFTDIKKGDIIFNHKQTEDLLSKGYVTGRGKAYANGTAYREPKASGIVVRTAAQEVANARQEKLSLNLLNETRKLAEAMKEKAPAISTTTKTPQISDTGSTGNGKENWPGGASEATTPSGGRQGSGSGSGSSKDESEQIIDFIEIKLEEIESKISKTTAKLESYADDASDAVLKDKNDAYNILVNAEKEKAATYFDAAQLYNQKAAALLKDIPEKYRSMAQNGAIAIEDFVGESEGKIADSINKYREMATKADDAENGYLEAIAQQTAYRVEQIEDIADDFDNIVNFINTKSTLLQAHMDTMEESGERIGENMYKALIESTKQQKVELEKERKELQAHLNAAVTSGEITKYSDEWYQLVGLINEVDESIIQCDTDIKSFYNSIKEVRFEALDKLVSRFEAIDSELSHLYDRFTDDDKFVDDTGNWTDEGIAAMGVLAQQMEVAQTQSEQYAKAIDDLKKNWKTLGLSEDEYNEKLAELTENQWDSIEAYEDAKDALVDLNKTRIDAVKEGMEKEIDAYKELIELQKESLDAEKDAHDFEKEVAEQEKDITSIERKIAALRGDTSTSAAAQRKQLEAELLEAKAKLEETYYDRSVEKQKEALDDEYERYEKNMQDEMDALDEYLEDSEKVIRDSMATVKDNASIVLKEIDSISKKYGIDITQSITNPWKDGSNAITGYQDSFKKLASSFAQELDKIIEREKALQQAAENAANSVIGSVNGTISGTTGAENPKPAGGTKVTYIDPNGKTQFGYAINGKTYTKDIEDDKYRVPVGSIVTDKAGRQWLMTPNGGVPYTGGSTSGSTSSGNPGYVSDIKATLQKGQSGPSVNRVQETLNKLGFNCGTADGIFGEKTYKAVQAFQRDTRWGGKIAVDGIVGAATKKKFKLAGYAKGTTGVKNDQFAWIDEIGEELVLHAGNDGKLSYLTKGTGVVPADLTSKLMDLALDPTQTLDASRPVINAPHIVNNEINIDMSFGSVVNIEHVDNDTIPDLTKAVEKQMDKYMKNLNNQIRKYSR